MFLKKANIDDIIDMGKKFQTYCQNHQKNGDTGFKKADNFSWFNDRCQFLDVSLKGNLSPILLTSAQRRFSSWMQISIETTTTCADHPRLDKEKFRPILETCFLKKMEIANESKSRQTLSLQFSVGLIGDFFSLQLYLTLHENKI